MYRLEAVTDIYDMYMYQVTPMILEHIFHLWKAIIWRMEAIHMPHLLDAGYGSFDNYKYDKEHGIQLYMKYSGMRKEAEKKTTKNQFTRAQMNPNEEDKIICPANHEFTLVDTRIERRGVYPREIEMYQNEHCEGCPFKSKCTKSKRAERYKGAESLNPTKKKSKKIFRLNKVKSI